MTNKNDIHQKVGERGGLRPAKAMGASGTTIEPEIEKTAQNIPKVYRSIYLRTVQGEASPRQAIKMFCLECVGYIKKEVSRCTEKKCPLWKYRPYAEAEESEVKK